MIARAVDVLILVLAVGIVDVAKSCMERGEFAALRLATGA